MFISQFLKLSYNIFELVLLEMTLNLQYYYCVIIIIISQFLAVHSYIISIVITTFYKKNFELLSNVKFFYIKKIG